MFGKTIGGFTPSTNNAQLEQITYNGTAKPVVPLLKATYDANKAFYDAQDVIWAIHETPIV